MELPRNLQNRLADEFRIVAQKMQEEEDPLRKLYFFSAIYADIGRTLNWIWDKDLVLVHAVTQNAYERMNGGLQIVTSGRNRAMRIDSAIFDYLDDAVEHLAQYFEGKGNVEEFYELLRRFAELSYATTGNGSYLMEKGFIKL